MNLRRIINTLNDNVLTSTEFLKDNNNLEVQLEYLKKYRKKLNEEGQTIIDKDIKILESGIRGENNIKFELKNSNIPMYVLHDLNLEFNGLKAQIDYMIITNKKIYLIECKNLWGNLIVDYDYNFCREVRIDGEKQLIGMYSPLEQSKRHLRLIEQIKAKYDKTIKAYFKKDRVVDRFGWFVVMANPETYIHMKAPKGPLYTKVVRGDSLTNYIAKDLRECELPEWSKAKMLDEANYYLSLHKENTCNNYVNKYDEYLINIEEVINERLVKTLKKYRFETSVKNKIKPYEVFKNDTLDSIIQLKPSKIEDLDKVYGLDYQKINNFGKDIVNIVNRIVKEYADA